MEIEDRLRKVLHTDLFVETLPEEIGLDDGLRVAHGLDSLGFLELRVQCEELFDVQISEENFTPEHFKSLRTLSELVRSLQENQHS